MTQRGGAPAALQPDDTLPGEDEYVEMVIMPSDKSGPYLPPVMDAGAAARAGDWLGVRVYHAGIGAFGRIVGRAPNWRFWVTMRPPGKREVTLLVVGDTLTVATPEFCAALEAKRAHDRAMLARRDENRVRFTKKRSRLADNGITRQCSACGETKPIDDFPGNRPNGSRRLVCRACANRQRREREAAQRIVVLS